MTKFSKLAPTLTMAVNRERLFRTINLYAWRYLFEFLWYGAEIFTKDAPRCAPQIKSKRASIGVRIAENECEEFADSRSLIRNTRPIKQAQKFLSIKTILSHLVSRLKTFLPFPYGMGILANVFLFWLLFMTKLPKLAPTLTMAVNRERLFRTINLYAWRYLFEFLWYGAEIFTKDAPRCPPQIKSKRASIGVRLAENECKEVADSRSLYETLTYKACSEVSFN